MDKLEKIGTKMAIIVTLAGLLIAVPLIMYFNPLQRRETMELHEIAYDSLGRSYRSQDDITVYIRENGVWEPFLVLEASYPGEGNGGTLLLRRYLIQERRPWLALEDRRTGLGGENIDFRYYPMSSIDTWLENEYIQVFSESMQARMLTTNVEVWDGWDHGRLGAYRNVTVTETVPRTIFLLSENETGWIGPRRANRAAEGEPIAYFNTGRREVHQRLRHSRLAATPRYEYTGLDDGRWAVNYSWWLRSVRWTTATGTIAVIMSSGSGNQRMHSEYTFVRPALTLPRDTIIELYEINGRRVYVIHD